MTPLRNPVFSRVIWARVSIRYSRTLASALPLAVRRPRIKGCITLTSKEIIGNKYGTPSPVPFRVVDQRAGIDIDIAIRCFGEYSYRVANPLLFYTNVCGNVEADFDRGTIDSQLKKPSC